MITLLCAVYDEKAQLYNSMFFPKNIGTAIRGFGDACRDPKTVLHAHPEDYSLYHIGHFDDESGQVQNVIPPVFLARATEFKQSNPAVSAPSEVING